MNSVPLMDLTVHLASHHGLVPQSAVNSLLLWVLTTNTFALNDSAQASLKAKFKDQAGPPPAVPKSKAPATSLLSANTMRAPLQQQQKQQLQQQQQKQQQQKQQQDQLKQSQLKPPPQAK